jgi:hypothetical protein
VIEFRARKLICSLTLERPNLESVCVCRAGAIPRRKDCFTVEE